MKITKKCLMLLFTFQFNSSVSTHFIFENNLDRYRYITNFIFHISY